MSTPSSLQEKEVEWRMQDTKTAANKPVEYEPIRSEPAETAAVNADLEASHEKRSTRGDLSRLQSSTSGVSEYSDEVSSTRSTKKGKKKWYKRANPLKWGAKPPIPTTREVSAEYHAGWFSRLTWQWMSPIMTVGYKRPLEHNDLWTVNPDRSVDVMAERLQASFKRRREEGTKRPLLGALYDTFKRDFIIGGLCQLLASVVQSVAPFVLRYLIAFALKAYIAQARGLPQPNLGEGFGLVIGITLMQFTQSMATNHFMYRGMMVGGQARAVLIALIFDKAMKLSGRAKAGGQAFVQAPPPEVKPGSEAEKKWYQKILKKKQKETAKGTEIMGDGQGWGNGRIINLMSTDTYRVDQASGFFHMIWTSPVQILITVALLLVNLKYSALPGLGLLIVTMPVLGRAVRSLFRRRIAINKITDQRVSLTQEILQAVRFVKYFGWETSFLERVDGVRRKEIRGVQVLLAIRNGIMAVGMSMPVFASMLAFITYRLTGNNLNPAPIFSSLALFNSLRLPLNFLPLVIGQVIDANASIDRIQEFLLAEEAEESAEWNYDAKDAVVLKNADFTWERHPTRDDEETIGGSAPKGPPKSKKELKQDKKGKKQDKKDKKQEEKDKRASVLTTQSSGSSTPPGSSEKPQEEEQPFAIKGMDITIGRQELIAVIGSVGSGKSSLLAALAGDMRKTQGEVTIGASRAFCPQYAWIQNATVRENIVFGKEFRDDWYNRVVDACALRPDLEMLPNGDKTEIGERGITVSGGQKQRMNIARAIYFDADIILMDDPLSAVDAHVGRHIMDNAICGLLKDKCRILATHQLHVLSRCDRIIWIEEGGIQAVDTFDNLMAHNAGFQQLMTMTASEEDKEEVDDEDEVEDEKKMAKKTKKKKQKPPVALMQEEDRATKAVGWDVWIAYLKAGGGLWVGPLVALLLILSQGANICTSLWLSWWVSHKWQYNEGTYVSLSTGYSRAQLTDFDRLVSTPLLASRRH
jgi:ATP-binding cassette subfamily C (CFTR/MRP) protein 1